MLVEDQKLDGIVSMPSGVFRPYAGVSTAILLFTKTNSGGTDHVSFYEMTADGFSLDDKRNPLDQSKHEQNNLPDILARWQSLRSLLPRAGEGGPQGREREVGEAGHRWHFVHHHRSQYCGYWNTHLRFVLS